MHAPLIFEKYFPQRLVARMADELARKVARMRWGLLAILGLAVTLWMFALIGVFSVARAMSPAPALHGVSAAELARAVIPGLPEYPGATLSEFREEIIGGERLTEIEYLVDSPEAELHAHYRAAFAHGGWTVTDTSWQHGEWVYTVSSGARRAVVELELRDGLTEVEVELIEPASPPESPTDG